MFRGYWLPLIVVGLGLVSALIYANLSAPDAPSSYEAKRVSEQIYTEQGDNQNADHIDGFRFYAPITNPEAEEQTQSEPEKTQTNASGYFTPVEADLLAQERVAHWTAWIGGFTAIGLFALAWTIIETRQIGVETQKIGEVQNRPYVNIDPSEIGISLDAKDHLTIKILMRNKGSTPAFGFAMRCAIVEGAHSHFQEARHPHIEVFNRSVIAPDAYAFSELKSKRPLTAQRIRDLNDGQEMIGLIGVAEYNSFNGQRDHLTKFKLKVTVIDEGGGRITGNLIPAENGNEAT